MIKLCPNCKSPVPEEASFCLNCFTGNIRAVSETHKKELNDFLNQNGFSSKDKKSKHIKGKNTDKKSAR